MNKKKKKETKKSRNKEKQFLEKPKRNWDETIGEWLDGSDWVGKWIKKKENEKENSK